MKVQLSLLYLRPCVFTAMSPQRLSKGMQEGGGEGEVSQRGENPWNPRVLEMQRLCLGKREGREGMRGARRVEEEGRGGRKEKQRRDSES